MEILGENKVENKMSLKEKVRHFLAQEFFKNGLVHWVLIGSFFVNLADWGLLAFFVRPVDFLIILHYNVYFGVDILGSWQEAYFLPAVGTFFLAMNVFLGYFFYQRKERIATYLFLLGAFIVQAGVLIAEASIIKINF